MQHLMQEENNMQSVAHNQNERIPPTNLAESHFISCTCGQRIYFNFEFQGTLYGRKVLMLVDSGLTHNFVAEEIVTELGLAVQYTPSFGVHIGNREIIKCNKVCRDLSIEVSKLVIKDDFFHFPLVG